MSIVAISGCGDSDPSSASDSDSSTAADSAEDGTGTPDDEDGPDGDGPDGDGPDGDGPDGDGSTSATETSGGSTGPSDDTTSDSDDSGDDSSDDTTDDTGPVQGCDGPPSPGGLDIADFIPTAAQSTCDALFRCCDTVDLEAYFAPLLDNESLADLVDQLPPNAELTPEACPALMAEIMTVQPLGPWLDAAQSGLVAYDGVAAQACVDAMDAADCSADIETGVLAALYDGTCLALSPPLGGDDQRRMFERCSAVGDSCRRLNDGFGGIIYGTCNPRESFCCVGSDSDPEACALGAAEDAEGTCVRASDEDEPCTVVPALQWCATGVECVESTCLAPPEPQPVGIGETCIDEDGFTIGECTGGFCDFFESICVALREDGEDCQAGYECVSGGCNDSQCGAPTFCVDEG